jgi:hypothetical protein
MRPDDDLRLGKLIKIRGYRQEPLFGKHLLHVEWYSSLRELINGLMKNAFAGVDYSIFKVVAASIVLFTFNVWPFMGMFLTHGVAQFINFIIVGLIFLGYRSVSRFQTVVWNRVSNRHVTGYLHHVAGYADYDVQQRHRLAGYTLFVGRAKIQQGVGRERRSGSGLHC